MTHDKPLFTPGPLTTSRSVKEAMLRDLGSRDEEFISIVEQVRKGILDVAGVGSASDYESVLLQGSGTYGIESALTSLTPPAGSWLFLVNGAYGERMVKIAEVYGIGTSVLRVSEDQHHDITEIRRVLESPEGRQLTGLAVVHCETTTGIVNPIEAIGTLAKEFGKTYLVDSMSAFGAVPIDFEACAIDVLISSSNKCIEGVPGFSFVICRRQLLQGSESWARTVTLDLRAQWQGLNGSGQFRFTPPTHVILAFHQALEELRGEGGVAGRARRYQENRTVLAQGMLELGFHEFVPADKAGYIITSYRYPKHDSFNFERFYEALSQKGFVIYPGKLSHADCFRIGNIGRLDRSHMEGLLKAIAEVLAEQKIHL